MTYSNIYKMAFVTKVNNLSNYVFKNLESIHASIVEQYENKKDTSKLIELGYGFQFEKNAKGKQIKVREFRNDAKAIEYIAELSLEDFLKKCEELKEKGSKVTSPRGFANALKPKKKSESENSESENSEEENSQSEKVTSSDIGIEQILELTSDWSNEERHTLIEGLTKQNSDQLKKAVNQ